MAELLSLEELVSGVGDAGPGTALTNKQCTDAISVHFANGHGGALLTIVAGAPAAPGDYGNPVWEIYGPAESAVTLTGAVTDSTRTFTADYPGRYFVRLTATPWGGSATTYPAGVAEVKDPQLNVASIPAPNEAAEFDSAFGWSRDAEQAHKTFSKSLGFREIVSVVSAGALINAGKLVAPSGAWLAQWKLSNISYADFNNFVIEVVEVDDAAAAMATGPVFLLLEDTDSADPTREKALALVKGIVPIDTTVFGGAPANGVDIYADGVGGNPEFTTTAPGVTDRKVGKIINNDTEIVSPPGSIYFDGHFEAFYYELYVANKLTVGGLIDPTGVEFEPVAANPGGIPANTIWLDSLDSDKPKIGSSDILLSSSVRMDVQTIVADPFPAVNNTSYVCTGGPFTVTLPPVGTSLGFRITIVNNTPADVITVAGDAADTIIGAITYPLPAQWDSVTVWTDGLEWFVE
jgi:hypothetical protein